MLGAQNFVIGQSRRAMKTERSLRTSHKAWRRSITAQRNPRHERFNDDEADDLDKKFIELAANNPDEFPWSNDVCIQRCEQPTDSLVTLRWRNASAMSTEEQSARRFFLDKYSVVLKGLTELHEANLLNHETKRLFEDLKRAKSESIKLWVKKFPEEYKERFPKVYDQHNKTTVWEKLRDLISPRKRKRDDESLDMRKRFCPE